MAVVVTKEIKKKRILLAIAGGIVVVSLLILYFDVYYQPVLPSTEQAGIPTEALKKPDVSDINLGIFDDDRFKDLQISPGVPIATDTPGKANPFSE